MTGSIDPNAPPSGTPTTTAVDGSKQADMQALSGDVLPAEAVFRRAEDKPPLYRFFRGGMYVSYMAVVLWFCLAILIAAVQSVWGEPGRALRARDHTVQPLSATPQPTSRP